MKPFNQILLFNLILGALLAALIFISPQVIGKSADLSFILMMLGTALIGLQGLACLVASIVFFVQKKQHHGLGFLLSAFLVWILGFGTCSATLFTFN